MTKSFLVSLLLHLMLLSLFFIKWHNWEKSVDNQVGFKQAINSYIIVSPEQPILMEKPKVVMKDSAKSKIVLNHEKTHKVISINRIQRKGNYNQFIIYLHNLIQQHVVVPNELIDFINNHRVKIAFSLSPTGNVSHLIILQSSGIASVDKRILSTINYLQPILAAKKNLKHTSHFIITIVL